MATIKFSHQTARERGHQYKLLDERAWFVKHNFPVYLPNNVDSSTLNKDFLLIRKKISKLEKRWLNIEAKYFNIAKNLNHAKLLKNYICHISLYGPEGQFTSPNLIYARLRTKKDEGRILETIGHELLHLIFSNYFQYQNVNYREAEWLVDNIILQSDLHKLFPHYKKQSVGKSNIDILHRIII